MAGNIGGFTSLSGLSLGAGSGYSCGTPVYNVSSMTVGVVALTVTATKSTESAIPFPGATTDDTVIATCSGLSAGVVLTAYPDAANSVTLRYSNVSTANAAQTAQTVRITRMQFV